MAKGLCYQVGSISYIVQLVRAMVTLVSGFSFSVICQVVQKILKAFSCLLLKGK